MVKLVMELKMEKLVQVMRRKDTSIPDLVEVEAGLGEDPTVEEETNIHPVDPLTEEGHQVTAEINILAAVEEDPDLLTAETVIEIGIPEEITPDQDQDLEREEQERLKKDMKE